MRISVTADEFTKPVEEYIRKKYGLKSNVRLVLSSKTTFLTFDSEEE